MVEELFHYSAEPLGPPKTFRQHSSPDMKPKGLWVSVGDEWEQWCRGENFGEARLKWRTAVLLKPEARILYLRNSSDIDTFGSTYCAEPEWRRRFNEDFPVMGASIDRMWINWQAVERDGFQGILIAPYCWARRLDMSSSWYYGWDCASGCLWDGAAYELGVAEEVIPCVVSRYDEQLESK